MDPLAPFSEKTRGWFERAFAGPTPAQTAGWPAIATGGHVLIQAPTGSGKTLAAFLHGIDTLDRAPGTGLRLLYVSPLKALNYDVERNLRGPLAGIKSDLRVGVRTGDTTQKERRELVKEPPDILITTPESLFLMLTSQARETLRGIETVILDEVHAVAGTKRGAHLALSLERLDALLERPAQRIGLSATQRPLEEIGRFVSGDRPIQLVDAGTRKELDLEVVVPVEDLRELGTSNELAQPVVNDDVVMASGYESTARSIWPSIYPADPRARQGAPLDDRLRQQSAARRAARGAAERARRGRDRAGPPRLAGARAAGADRGGPEGGADPVPRRDLQPRARDRHGRRRPRDPGREPEVGRARPAAGRPSGSRARLDLEGPHLPQVPRRSARVCGRREGDARGRDRGDADPAQPARRARAADRRDRRRGGDRGRGAAHARPRRLSVLRPLAAAARERARHARGPLPLGRVRRAAAADRLGSHRPASSAAARARGGSPSRTRARSPTAASTASTSSTAAAAWASSTRRWSTRRGRGRRSCSARRPGGSRRSRATGSSSRPRPACPAPFRSGRAKASAGRSSSARRSAAPRGS